MYTTSHTVHSNNQVAYSISVTPFPCHFAMTSFNHRDVILPSYYDSTTYNCGYTRAMCEPQNIGKPPEDQ